MSKCSVCGSNDFSKEESQSFVLAGMNKIDDKIQMNDRILIPVRVEKCNVCNHLDLFALKENE